MPKNKIKIFLRGAYNSYNFGDDIILASILYFLEKNLKIDPKIIQIYIQKNQCSFEKLGYENPFKFKDGKEIDEIFVFINNRLKIFKFPKFIRIIFIILSLFTLGLSICFFRIFKRKVLFKDFISFFEDLDIIQYIGGGYITDRWLRRMLYEFLMVNIAKLINPNLKIIGTGLGLGPFEHKISIIFIKNFLNKFNYLFLRERESFNLVKKLNIKGYIKCCGDDALLILPLLKNLKINKNKFNKNIIAINLKDFPDHNYYGIRNVINNLFEFLHKKNFCIEFFSFGQKPGPDDCKILQDLDIDNKNICSIYNPYKIGIIKYLQKLAQVRFGFGFAYHFNLILAIMSIPSISIYAGDYYKQKIKESMALFGNPYVFSINAFKNQNLEIILNKILQYKYDESKKINLYKNIVKEYTLMYNNLIENN